VTGWCLSPAAIKPDAPESVTGCVARGRKAVEASRHIQKIQRPGECTWQRPSGAPAGAGARPAAPTVGAQLRQRECLESASYRQLSQKGLTRRSSRRADSRCPPMLLPTSSPAWMGLMHESLDPAGPQIGTATPVSRPIVSPRCARPPLHREAARAHSRAVRSLGDAH
jgi:hypothetical protein